MKYKILKTAFFDRRIAQLILHVTNRCNNRCNTCFVDFNSYNGSELEIDEIERISNYVKDILWLNIGGGEPFLRKDLPQICSLFTTKIISIPTNGYNPELIYNSTQKIINKIDIKSMLNISISIDGFEKTNDNIRTKGSFKKALKTLELLKSLDNISIKINTVLCEQNIEEIIEFMRFIKSFNVDFHSIIFLRGKPINSNYKLPSYEKLCKIKNDIFHIWAEYSYASSPFINIFLKRYHRLLYNNSLKILKEKKQTPVCLAHKFHLVIFPEGDVSFCELLNPIGSLKEHSIEEIINSKKAKNMRKFIKEKKCYCHHNCNFLDNIFLNPSQYPKLLFGIGTK